MFAHIRQDKTIERCVEGTSRISTTESTNNDRTLSRKDTAKPAWLSDVDIRIIRTIATHHYMTAKDIAYSVYEPTSLTYVRSRAARLAGCADHIPNQYLYRFSRPHTDPGRSEKVFTVGTKGRELLASLQGVDDISGFKVSTTS